MGDLTSDSTAPRVPCEVVNCNKDYATKGTMMVHVEKHHKVSDQIDSPLGSFPTGISARVLFNDQTEGVQGNSAGQVNIPEVRSAPTFICGKCEKGFETQAKLNKHKEEEQDDDDLLHAVREAEELYNALEILTQSEYDQEKDKESKQEMKEKLTRFWDILKKKTEFQMKSVQKIQNLEANSKASR